jgi:hypothetical protein
MNRLLRLGVLVVLLVIASMGALLQCDQSDTSTVAVDAALAVPTLSLTATPTPMVPVVPNGTVWSVSVCATQGLAEPSFSSCATAGSEPTPSSNLVDGLSVTFASTTTGVVLSPAMILTNASGLATSEVVVPFGTQVAVVVSGSGTQAVILVPPSDAGPTSIPVTLTATFAPIGIALPAGVVYQLSVEATAGAPTDAMAGGGNGPPIAGLNVAFSTTTTGVSFSPASVATDNTGTATSNVVVPYGTEVQAVFSGGGSANAMAITAPAVQLSLGPLTATGDQLPSGETYSLTVTASVNGGTSSDAAPSDGGSGMNIQGLNISFATTTTGISFSPSTVATNAMGVATSNVVIPYGTAIQPIVSGGGTVTTPPAEGGTTIPQVALTPTSFVPTGIVLPTGVVYQLSVLASLGNRADAMADGGNGPPIAGLNVAFSTTTTGVSFSPASAATNALGVTTSSVVVPYGTEIQAVVSGGGTVIIAPASDAGVTASSVVLSAALEQPDSSAACASPGPCTLQIIASEGNSPVVGLGVGFVITDFLVGDAGSSGSATIAGPPSPILTNTAGTASYTFVIPANVVGFIAAASAGGSTASVQYGQVP